MKPSCAECGAVDIEQTSSYYSREGTYVGEWPLYYFGASPNEPHNAEAYFCDAFCANAYKLKLTTPEQEEQ